MSGKIVHLIPPGAIERIRAPLPRDPLEGRLAIPAPVRLYDPAEGRSHPDISWVWKISATVTLGMIALALLVLAAFILGTGYDIANTKKRTAEADKVMAEAAPVVIVQPNKTPPPLPDTASLRPEIAVDKSPLPKFIHEDHTTRKNQPVMARNVAPKLTTPITPGIESREVPKNKVTVNALEITHADGETTVHKIGKVEKFRPKEGGKNVQE